MILNGPQGELLEALQDAAEELQRMYAKYEPSCDPKEDYCPPDGVLGRARAAITQAEGK